MDFLFVLSGAIASGKSVLAGQLEKRFDALRVSTRQLLLDHGAPNERAALIKAGWHYLDVSAGGA